MEDHVCFYCMMPVEEGKNCPNCGHASDPYTPAVYHLPLGTVLKERYLIGRVLGEGGFGITYIGYDLRLKMRVAVKEYFPKDKANRISKDDLSISCHAGSAAGRFEEGREQFLQEALILAKMDKQSVIVGVRDFFEENNTAYIVMEYVDGTTFKDLTERGGGHIPPAELMKMMEPLFSALGDMHAKGLIHRDISPENLMLENGEIRLLDFGCARESQNGDSTLTVTMKQGYAPVEQYQNKGQGPWTDVYALSATIYFCLTGIKPPQSVDRLVEDELIPPRKLGVKLTERQERAILHGMDVRPRRRFQSVGELHDALYGNGGVRPSRSASPDAARKEKKTDPPEEKKGRKTTGKYVRIAAYTGALVLVALLAVRLSKPETDISEPEHTAGSDQSALLDHGEHPDVSRELSEEELRAALANDNIPEVVIPAGSHLEILSGSLEIGKPLLIEPGAELYTFQPITVIGGGRIRVEGAWEYRAPVRAAGGGGLEVGTEGGMRGQTLVWLDSAGDLTVAEGGSAPIPGKNGNDAPNRLLIFDEEALFKDAIHVTTLEEYDRCRLGNVPVVIDADICLTEYNRCHTVPVLISEGVNVTVPVSGEAYCSWDVNGTLLVNRGTIHGRVVAGDWKENGIDSDWKIVNYGTIDGGFWSVTDSGMMVNLGTLRGDGNSTGGFYNLGLFTPSDYQIRQGPVCNAGRVLVGDGSKGRLVLNRISHGFGNSGSLEIGAAGELYNYGTIQNYGHLVTTDASASLWNAGLLCNAAASSAVDMHPESLLGNSGVLQYGEDTVMRLSDNRLNGGSVINFRWGGDEARTVCTESELRIALIDHTCKRIAIDGCDIAVEDDLTVTKGLTITSSGSLTMSGNDLSVSGDGAFLFGNVDLGGGTLTLLSGASAVGEPFNCGGLTIRDPRSGLVTTGSFSPNPGAEVELSNGGSLIALESLKLEKSVLSVGQWSTLRPCAGFWLEGCEVEIAREGELRPTCAGYYFDSKTTVVNHGFFREEETWYDQSRELACGLKNYGWIELRSGARVSGDLENQGTVQFSGGMTLSGVMDNLGRVFAVNGEMEKESGGTFTGHPVEYRDVWTVPELE